MPDETHADHATTEAPSGVPVEVAIEAASTLETDAGWQDVVAASTPAADNRSSLARALDELQAVAAEIGRLTGSLSLEHASALDSAVQNVVTAAAPHVADETAKVDKPAKGAKAAA